MTYHTTLYLTSRTQTKICVDYEKYRFYFILKLVKYWKVMQLAR